MNPKNDHGRIRNLDERGSVFPLVGLLMVSSVAIMWFLAAVTADLADASKAQTAADAGALAGAGHGVRAARLTVQGNGASVISVKDNAAPAHRILTVSGSSDERPIGDVTVIAQVGRHQATARAQSSGLTR